MAAWLAQNWFTLLSSVGIIGSLLYGAISLREATKTQRIANLLQLTQNHRELWTHPLYKPELNRVFDSSADLSRQALTTEEVIFVKMVVQHLNSAYEAIKSGLTVKPEGVRRDVWAFFSLPIPRAVWKSIKNLQNDDFATFVENCLNWK